FFITLFITLYWIHHTYKHHFHPSQLPKFMTSKKSFLLTTMLISVLFGLFGSSVVQKLGWEPLLKFLNRTNFNISDPHFHHDVSFYEFTLPFITFAIYTVITLMAFLLLVIIGAYSVFRMYRVSRQAQIHLSIYVLLFACLLATIHFFGRYDTLLTDQVNIMQKSVVHGLSYTDA